MDHKLFHDLRCSGEEWMEELIFKAIQLDSEKPNIGCLLRRQGDMIKEADIRVRVI